jgi:FMN phosphatase YigB (HAD superfamily)
MAYKSLLLDVDGVLVRDKLLLNHVKDNCVKYVASKLPEAKNPRDVNRVLHLSHGHTARGLNMVFKIDTSDFNEKVYDKNLLDHLSEVIYGTEFQQEAKEIHDLSQNGWKVTLFTNSPIEWAGRVARAIGDDVFVTCPENFMKPEVPMYTQFPNHNTHIYVDDSMKNLGTARWLSNWKCVYFNEGDKEQRMWCPQVGSMWELLLYINSVDQWILDNHLGNY